MVPRRPPELFWNKRQVLSLFQNKSFDTVTITDRKALYSVVNKTTRKTEVVMRVMRVIAVSVMLLLPLALLAQESPKPPAEKARVFKMRAAEGGSSVGFGGAAAGGARPQTAEIIKTFGEKCPQVLVNNIQAKADYVVVLDHEGRKGLLRHKNKVAVFGRLNGDAVVSKSTLSLGGSVETACEAIVNDWDAHAAEMRAAELAAENKAGAKPRAVVLKSGGKLEPNIIRINSEEK